MNDILNPAQNISYTNKDFQTLFPELLDLTKRLTSRWDPSISNESDPGVVLLKLNAIIADKLNYNIDKNVLECFPLSVTQISNARNLFSQLGYRMHWYKSAYTNVSIKWNGDINTGYIEIPAFTMVSDADNTVVYSLVGSPTGVNDDEFNVSTEKLNYNGDLLTLKAIQGIAIKYDVNGNTVIKASNLDEYNRLYFSTNDIAENGIFITNVGSNNYSSWKRKDNLIVENTNNNYYSLGVSEDGSVCYIEFPEDAENVIKDGIEITYIKSIGESGNINVNTISKFYTNVYLTDSNSNTVILTEDNIVMYNYESAMTGKNPETINSAYRNYKKTVGTFDVLVTLRDYINYILRSGLVSNCFLCDRTNDIQCVYSIMTYDNELNILKTVQEPKVVEKRIKQLDGTIVTEDVLEDSLSAFDLKLYLLKSVQDLTTLNGYNQSFDMISNEYQSQVKYYLEDQKSISHDYADIEPITLTSAHVCYFKNKYPINCRIITKYQLTSSQAAEVAENIRNNFLKNLNAYEIEFSEPISLELINDLIVNSDERIKSAIIDNIEYTTYAVYWDGASFVEVDISSNDYEHVTTTINYSASDYDPTSGYLVDDYCVYNGERYKCTTAINAPAGRWNSSKWTSAGLSVSVDEETFVEEIGFNNYDLYTFTYDNNAWELDSVSVSLSSYGITVTGTPEDGDEISVKISVVSQIRDEIFSKSVLAGVTPFYKNSELFDYSFNHLFNDMYEGVEKITSNVTMSFTSNNPIYTLKSNEFLQLYAPNFINGTSYSNYVKFEYNINTDISADSDYQLKSGEYIIFYWKTEDNQLDVYNYYVYARGNVIHPTFIMPKNTSGTIGSSLADSSNLRNIGSTINPILIANSDYNGPMSSTISDAISSLVSRNNILSGVKSITIRKINSIELDSSYLCYWVLNDSENGNYVLFEEDLSASSQTYILNNGEYFFYTNGSLTQLGILGAGTSITRDSGVGTWVVPATIELSNILENGTSALTSVWQHPIIGQNTEITENQYITIGPSSSVQLSRIDGMVGWEVDIDKDGVVDSSDPLINYSIQYKTPNDEDWIDVNAISVTSIMAGWDARTLLAINTGSKISQNLLANQTVDLYYSDDTVQTITGSDVQYRTVTTGNTGSASYASMEIPYYPVTLESKYNISFDGGGSYSVYNLTDLNDIEYNSIYNYEEQVTSADKVYRVTNSGDIILTFKAGVNNLTIPYSIPVGTYMFRITNPSMELTTLTVKDVDSDELLSAIYDDTLTNFANSSNLILKLEVDTLPSPGSYHSLLITLSDHIGDIVLTLSNPFKYSKQDYMSDFEYEKIEKRIIELDTDHIYNYMYQPDPDDSIVNPLLATSFLENNHIYNNYVICQLDTTNTVISILNKK